MSIQQALHTSIDTLAGITGITVSLLTINVNWMEGLDVSQKLVTLFVSMLTGCFVGIRLYRIRPFRRRKS